VILLSQLAVQAAAQSNCNKVSFAAAVSLSGVGAYATGIAAGDFNNDGIPDLAVVARTNGIIEVALGKGNGTFQPWIYSSATYSPTQVAVGRFDGQNLDTVVNDAAFLDASVLLGNGTGYFPSSTFISVGENFTRGFAVGDFNGDKKDDLAVTDSIGNVYIYVSNGDGTFQGPQIFPTGGIDPEPIVAGDFNGDGILDLAILNLDDPDGGANGSLALLLGKGNGTFGAPLLLHFPKFFTNVGSAIAAGDFDGDHKLDVAVTGTSYSGVIYLVILLGNGNGTFHKGAVISAGSQATAIQAADFNSDGKLDLAIANDTPRNVGYVSILVGNGDGSFQPPSYFGLDGKAPQEIAIADFNLDGKPDVATVDGLSSSISILLNTTPPCTVNQP